MRTREDMVVELSSDNVSSVFQLAQNDDYDNFHAWLQPLFMDSYKDTSDEQLEYIYNAQLQPND